VQPGLWGTALLAPGLHTVRMVVTDTGGQTASAEARVCVGTVTSGPCAAPLPDPGDGVDEDGGCDVAGQGGALAWLVLAGLLRRRRSALRS
jgi:hypothetical protein